MNYCSASQQFILFWIAFFSRCTNFAWDRLDQACTAFEALKSWGPGLDDYVSVVSGRPWLLSRYRRNLVSTLHQVSPCWLLSPLLLAKISANLLHALDECILEFEFHSQLVTDLFFLSPCPSWKPFVFHGRRCSIFPSSIIRA